jgi:hypothetical protein
LLWEKHKPTKTAYKIRGYFHSENCYDGKQQLLIYLNIDKNTAAGDVKIEFVNAENKRVSK